MRVGNIKVQGNKLLITRGFCGVLAIFGIPVAISGIFILLFFSFVGSCWLGFILQFLGLIIVTGCTGVVFNRDTEQMMTWWGAGFPLRCRYQSLNVYNTLVLDQKIDTGISSTERCNIYFVEIISEIDVALDPLLIYQSTDLLESRAVAEQIAQYTEKPLQDKSLDRPLIRQPKQFKKGLAYRLGLYCNQKQASFRLEDPPSEIIVRKTELGTEISILPSGFLNNLSLFLPHCMIVIITGIFILDNMDVSTIHQLLDWIAFVVFTFIFVITYLSFCVSNSITRIIIDNTEISVHQYQYASFRQSTQALQIQEIEGLFVYEASSGWITPRLDGQVLSLVSTTQTIEITGIHSSEKLTQLKKIIYQSIGFPIPSTTF